MKRFINMLEKTQIAVGVIFLCVFFLVIMLQITTRYMGISMTWTEEVANYSFVWAIFMGASVMVNRREHFNFDFIQRKLQGTKRLVLSIFNDLVLIIFNIFIFLLGVQVTVEFWDYRWETIFEMKMGYIWIVVPIMAITMIVYSLAHLMDHVKAFQVKEGNK